MKNKKMENKTLHWEEVCYQTNEDEINNYLEALKKSFASFPADAGF